MNVVGVGALNLDFIYQVDFALFQNVEKGTERRISLEEWEDLRVLLKKKGKLMVKNGGGSAVNTIYTLARMGFSCGFVGKVGTDREGDFLLQELTEAGVDTSKIVREGKTGICLILVDKNGERTTFILPNTNDTFSLKDVEFDYIQSARILHAASFLGEESFKTQKEIILRTGNLVSFDPGHPHVIRGWVEIFPLLKRTWVLFSTQKEIEILTGLHYKQGVWKILDAGVKIVICKMGESGSWIVSKEENFFLPAEKVKVLDTTGAGDVYAAGFLAGLLKGLPLKCCGKIATRAAGISVTDWGRKSYPGKEILELALKVQKNGI